MTGYELGSAIASAGRGALWLWDHTIGYLVRAVFLLLVRAYQLSISPLLPPSCRFHPSCSSYAYESIVIHGSVKGLLLASWRLLRCNPWNKGGLDPVPERGRWLPDIHPDGTTRLGPERRTA
ncbi:MAG: membrane protein insertion efficiency factor YidD [Candidatus Nanopelagicales bacterium]